jgi:NAD(P)-dependent dehydrogenase (short-subunit alcohol dehydrogenase family)
MPDLSNRVVVVTGASGNLGHAVSTALAGASAIRVLLDRSPGGPDHGADPERTMAVHGLDLTDPEVISGVLDRAGERFGRIDGLVATAGAFCGGTPAYEQGWPVWESMLTANVRTTVAASQAIIPRLHRGGRIVTVGARPGVSAGAGMAAYAATKSAVMRLTETLSEELKDKGITVNCVMPSIMDTPQNRAAMPSADSLRWVPPQDVADVVLFLLSDAARSITGALIPVYGRS